MSKEERWILDVRFAVRSALANVPGRDKQRILKEALDLEADTLGIASFMVIPKTGEMTVDGRRRKPVSTGVANEEEGAA